MACIFCKIGNKEVKSNIIYEDKELVVFPDINPAAPCHLLIVPKKHFQDIIALTSNKIWDNILKVIKIQVKLRKLEKKGFRVVINGGEAQLVDHLHIHLLGEVSSKRRV